MTAARVALNGACGRMGQILVALIDADDDLELSAALEAAGHPKLGERVGAGGITVSDALATDVDVMIDFSLPAGTVACLPTCVAQKVPMVPSAQEGRAVRHRAQTGREDRRGHRPHGEGQCRLRSTRSGGRAFLKRDRHSRHPRRRRRGRAHDQLRHPRRTRRADPQGHLPRHLRPRRPPRRPVPPRQAARPLHHARCPRTLKKGTVPFRIIPNRQNGYASLAAGENVWRKQLRGGGGLEDAEGSQGD